MADEKFMDKLRKLQAMRDGTDNEAEAAAFAAKLAELLAAHNLSEATLEVKEDVQEVGEDRMYNVKTGSKWAQVMAGAVADLYFCNIYLTTNFKGQTKIVFVGKPHNVEVAKSMTDYLIKTISRLANKYAKSPDAMADWDYTYTKARNGFERGAGQRMYHRITEMRLANQREQPIRHANGNPGNLPALYQDEKKAVAKFMEQLNLRKGSGRGFDTSGGHAAQGRAAANGISLNPQVGSASRGNLLGNK